MSSTTHAATPAHVGQPGVEYATPLEDDEDRLDAYYDDEPLRYRTVATSSESSLHWTSPRGSSLNYI
jgi:hypothetical protein